MKKVASALLLLIFTASTLGRIVGRTEAWAAQHAHRPTHVHSNTTGESAAEVHKRNALEKQTKLMEDGSVLYVSFVASTNIPPATKAFARTTTGFIGDLNNRPLSSRAPPEFHF